MSNGAPPPPPGSTPPPPPPASSPPPAAARPTPPASNPAAAGLPTWAKVAIGCGCLVLIAGAAAFVMLGLGIKKAAESDTFQKAKEAIGAAAEFDKDPATAAEKLINLHPQYEVVENDREAGKIRVRDVNTGEVGAFDYSQIKEGKFTFETDEGAYTIDGSEADEGGQIRVDGPDGQQVRIGTALDDVPSWVPQHPDASATEGGGFTSVQGDTASGLIAFEAAGSLDEIVTWYTETLEADGFTIERSTFETGGTRQIILQATKEGVDQLAVNVGMDSADSPIGIRIQYSGPQG